MSESHDQELKKVLFIAFDFPPRRTSGVYRHVGITKYLKSRNWSPTVLTAMADSNGLSDTSLLEDYPTDIQIARTSFFAIDAWESKVNRFFRWASSLNRPPSAPLPNQPPDPNSPATGSAPKSVSGVRRLLRSMDTLVRSILYFPDHTIGWVPFALWRALRLHQISRFDAVYTSSPAKSAPVVGLLLSLFTGLPWVAEFRDPWYPPAGKIRRTVESWLLGAILRRADAVVTTSKGLALEFETGFRVQEKKICMIPNGFDEAEFAVQKLPEGPVFQQGYFHFSHFGTVYPDFSGNFFIALLDLLTEQPQLKDIVRVNVVGFPDDGVVAWSKNEQLKDVVRIWPFMEQKQALQAMSSSDCLLVFLASETTSRLAVSGKLYWYLRVGRPILAIAHPGGTQELIEEGEAGMVVHPEDTAQIKKALTQILSYRNNGHPQPKRPEFVAKLRYDTLAGELAKVLDEVTNKKPRE